jgi:hypothetical protein
MTDLGNWISWAFLGYLCYLIIVAVQGLLRLINNRILVKVLGRGNAAATPSIDPRITSGADPYSLHLRQEEVKSYADYSPKVIAQSLRFPRFFVFQEVGVMLPVSLSVEQ